MAQQGNQMSGERQFSRFFPFVMVVITGTYLVVEMGFNASLLDALGNLSDPHEMERIEVLGRCISAAAVILALVGGRVKKGLLRGAGRVFYLTVALACVPVGLGVYYGEKAFVDYLVNTSSPEARQVSTIMGLVREGLHGGVVDLADSGISAETMKMPEGKALSALLPLLGDGVQRLTDKVGPAIPALIDYRFRRFFPDSETLRLQTHVAAVIHIQELYNKHYVPGANAYQSAIDGIPSRQREAWDRYLGKLKQNGYRPASVPVAGYERVRASVRKDGVPVDDNWLPYDEQGFRQAVERVLRQKADQRFAEGIRKALGSQGELPPRLSWEAFFRQEVVQKRLRTVMAPLFNGWRQIPVTFTEREFTTKVYAPWRKERLTELNAPLMAEASAFADGGKHAETGRAFRRAAVAPPIALLLSLLGAVVHLGKLSNYCGMLLGLPTVGRCVLVGLFVLVAGGGPYLRTNSVTDDPAYQHLAQEFGNPAMTKAVEWVMRTQGFVYPINNGLRHTALRDIL